MKKRSKYLLCLILTFAFLTSIFPQVMFAESNPKFNHEDVVKEIKEMFDTSKYDQFNINYNESKEKKIWDLNWSKSKSPYGSLAVSLDAENGNILNIYLYNEPQQPSKTGIPKLSEADARKKAEDFIKKIQPKEFSKTQFKEEPMARPLSILNRESYYFRFVRMENNIPVEDNGFNISVDANNGDILSYNFNWTYEKLPSANNIISKQEAEKIFKKEVGLNLCYKRYVNYRDKTDSIKLVYEVEPNDAIIDATTGKILDPKYYILYGDKEAAGDQATANKELETYEQKEIEATKNYISKAEAIKALEKYIKIPDGYQQMYANLYEDYNNPAQKVWNISWEKNTSSDDYGSIYARINAISAEIISFNIYDNSLYKDNTEPKIDRKAAQKIAEEFLKTIQPERLEEVKLEEPKVSNEQPDVKEHYFNYVRQVNDIPFISNGISISVDSSKGQIVSYNLKWNDGKFPSPEGILSQVEADDRFLQEIGYELEYSRLLDENGESKYYLLYRLKTSPSYTFDALTLEPLDYQGKPLEKDSDIIFNDIKEHWAEEDINLLVNMGIIKPTSDKFYPDKNITQGEFIKYLVLSNNTSPFYIDNIIDEKNDEDVQKYIDIAINLGWVKKEEIVVKQAIEREKMAAFVIRALGFDKVACLHDIYQTSAKDADKIDKNYKGHVVIANGLKLISEDNNKCLNPKKLATRAQAAAVLVRMLKLER